jgi:tetratricopeptide (TPR) repeat protein/DNA-binding XRE family transcriptional regulator
MSEIENYQFRKTREDFDITQSMLSEATGLSIKTISRADQGKPLSPFAANELCNYFSDLYKRKISLEEIGLISQKKSKTRSNDNKNISNDNYEEKSHTREQQIDTSLIVGDITHQAETKDWSLWVSLKLVQILQTINSYKRGNFTCEETCEEIQITLDQEIKTLDAIMPDNQTQPEYFTARKQALITIAALPTTFSSWKQPEPNDPIIEELLPQYAASITACWHLLQGKGFITTEELLSTYTPLLTTLAIRPSKYQRIAANLAVQTHIIQAIIAKHRLKNTTREKHCIEAVRYSRFTNDSRLQAAALMCLGYTYLYFIPPQPKRAIEIFKEALHIFKETSSLLTSDILIALADAYAQCKEENAALESITQAQNYFPLHPELDPSFIYADCNLSVLYQWEGKMYLNLAEHYPNRGYFQMAWNAFDQIKKTQPLHTRNTSEVIIDQALAAMGMNDLPLFSHYLQGGVQAAIEIGSQRRYSEAFSVYQKTPKKWYTEKQISTMAINLFKGQPPGEK